jgi:hypothetical protein
MLAPNYAKRLAYTSEEAKLCSPERTQFFHANMQLDAGALIEQRECYPRARDMQSWQNRF